MATPFGHSLAGYVVYYFSKTSEKSKQFGLIVLCILMANAPDLDFIPGILSGRPALYHQGITHSLGFALVISLAVTGICRLTRFRGESFPFLFTLCFISYLSHLLMDLLGPDRRPPYGIPLFWPVSEEHFLSPLPLFLGVRHTSVTSGSTSQWVDGLLQLYNIAAIALEILLIGSFILVARRYRNKPIA